MCKFTHLNYLRNAAFAFASIALSAGLSLMGQTPSYLPSGNLMAWYSFSGNTNEGSGNGLHGTSSSATYTAELSGNGKSLSSKTLMVVK
jgi:hypothetical protein